MSKPYDATSKELLQFDPVGWAAFLGVVRPADRIELRDTDLSTVTAAADKVLLVKDDPPWLLDVEFQSWCDPAAPRRLLKYNALLHERHRIPVASVLVVLAKDGDSTAYTGRHVVAPPYGPAWEFGYTVGEGVGAGCGDPVDRSTRPRPPCTGGQRVGGRRSGDPPPG